MSAKVPALVFYSQEKCSRTSRFITTGCILYLAGRVENSKTTFYWRSVTVMKLYRALHDCKTYYQTHITMNLYLRLILFLIFARKSFVPRRLDNYTRWWILMLLWQVPPLHNNNNRLECFKCIFPLEHYFMHSLIPSPDPYSLLRRLIMSKRDGGWLLVLVILGMCRKKCRCRIDDRTNEREMNREELGISLRPTFPALHTLSLPLKFLLCFKYFTTTL